MRTAQNGIGNAAAGLDALVGLFKWEKDSVSMGLAAGLLSCSVGCCMLPLR